MMTVGNDESSLTRMVVDLYRRAPLLVRWRERLRVRVCPLAHVVDAVPDDARVLDVGCGPGCLAGLLLGVGKASATVGFDVDRRAIAQARAMAVRGGFQGAASFSCRDIADQWPAGPFDAVLLVDVMHHVDEGRWRHVWPKAAAALRVGGLLIYKDMAREPRWAAWANRVHDMLFSRQWVRYADFERDVRRGASQAGLRVARRWRCRRLWYVHEAAVLKRV